MHQIIHMEPGTLKIPWWGGGSQHYLSNKDMHVDGEGTVSEYYIMYGYYPQMYRLLLF